MTRLFRHFANFFPKSLRLKFKHLLKSAGIRDDYRIWIGKSILVSFVTGILLILLYQGIYLPETDFLSAAISVLVFCFGFLISFVLIYMKLYFFISDRTSFAEKILPDFLLLTASNLRAGMSPFSAFIGAARPEFGDVSYEVKLSIAKSGTAASLGVALIEVGSYFNSSILTRTITLFSKGMQSGAQLSKLLVGSADEIRHIQDLRAELITATRTYAIFLGFIIIFVMPFLLSVSNQFLTVFLKIQSEGGQLDASTIGNLPSFTGKILIKPNEMLYMSIVTLTITSFLASALIGIVNRGRVLYGFRYFPIFAALSLIFFFAMRELLQNFFASFGL